MTVKNEFLSIPEAAALMGISRIAVFKKVKKGQLEAIRIGRNWAVPASSLEISGTAAVPPPRPRKKENATPVSGATGFVKARSRLQAVVPEAAPPKKDSMDDIGWD